MCDLEYDSDLSTTDGGKTTETQDVKHSAT